MFYSHWIEYSNTVLEIQGSFRVLYFIRSSQHPYEVDRSRCYLHFIIEKTKVQNNEVNLEIELKQIFWRRDFKHWDWYWLLEWRQGNSYLWGTSMCQTAHSESCTTAWKAHLLRWCLPVMLVVSDYSWNSNLCHWW